MIDMLIGAGLVGLGAFWAGVHYWAVRESERRGYAAGYKQGQREARLTAQAAGEAREDRPAGILPIDDVDRGTGRTAPHVVIDGEFMDRLHAQGRATKRM